MSKHILSLAVLVATVAMPILPARAADLDPGYAEIPALQEAKVEFGSGWYIRGDIAATRGYNIGIERVSTNQEAFALHQTHGAGYDLSIGGGYKFTNHFRTDVVADFHQPGETFSGTQSCITTTAITCTVSGKFTGYDALVNGYYDIGTWYHVTPYVGAGAGVAFGQPNARLDGDPKGTYYAKFGYQNFAFALMAGVAIDVFDHTKLDIGYRYLNNGRTDGAEIYFHEIRAGLRYMIDD